MENLVKVLHFLCLLSVTVCLQLTPSLNIKTPIDFLFNNINSKNILRKPTFNKQCFCIPKNGHSRPVLHHLDLRNEVLERVVIYLYKSNGAIKVYIPNENKQQLIPDLNFDDDEGDILKPVTSESITELFENGPFVVMSQHSESQLVEETEIEKEIMEIDSNKPQSHIIDEKDVIEDNNSLTPLPLGDNSLTEEHKPFDDQNLSIDNTNKPSIPNEEELTMNPELDKITTLDNDKQLEQIFSILPPQLPTDSLTEEVHPPSNELHQIPSMSPSQFQIPDSHNEENTQALNAIPDLNGYDDLDVLSMIPPKSHSHPESPIRQNPYQLYPKMKSYFNFYKWYDDQLKRVVLFNLETPSKIVGLRDRIKKVLQDNGMHMDFKGIVTDSNGNLVRLNNIKLRPILIGNQVESQHLLDNRNHLHKYVVPYTQVIEVILTIPTRLLGTLLLGTVWLPRNVNVQQQINFWNSHDYGKMNRNQRPGLAGCITCKTKYSQRPYSYPYAVLNGLQYPHITAPFKVHGSYYGVPFRRNFKTENEMRTSPSEEQAFANLQYVQHEGEGVGRSGIGSVFDGLLGNLGIAPNMFASPSRRLLGGKVPNGPSPGPKAYPNDVLPGFRIIGGNAATSSGTPLVSKGRSGFKKPSLII